MKSSICLLFGLLCLLPSLPAQHDSFEQKVRLMLELSDTKTTYDFLFRKTMEEIDAVQQTKVPDKYWAKHKAEMLDEAYQDLEGIIVDIYRKHFTEKEIDKINAFLKSKVGQKMRRIQPLILEEGGSRAEEWGKEFGGKMFDRIVEVQEELFNSPTEEDCSKFKEGRFEYFTSIEEEGETKKIRTEVKREGSKQIEDGIGQHLELEIVWLSNGQYLLIDPEAPEETRVIEVTIFEVNGNSFKYLSRFKGIDYYFLGEMTKLADK